jgi:predicted Zn-dependent protease
VRDGSSVAAALSSLRDTLSELPDDPHLSYATDVASSRSVRSHELPPAEEIIATVLDAAAGLDLVGIYAAGPVYRGFANSLGQRNWHEVTSFNLQWSLYHRADKAVKTAYGGFDWSAAAFAAKMDDARERLALLAVPARSLEPGSYRAYLTPTAMEEIAGMLSWGGFSGRALATRQSCLFRVQDGEAAFDPSVAFTENTITAWRRRFKARALPGQLRCRWYAKAGWSVRWSVRARPRSMRWPPTAPMRRRCPNRSTWRPAI